MLLLPCVMYFDVSCMTKRSLGYFAYRQDLD
uniref:Uncharacterized protein n=1 Tax=Arundo donax TaxID=35708 RepID=A0A0A9A4L2_ARUDO